MCQSLCAAPPNADDLKRYLEDFAETFSINLQYNTRVESISREVNGTSHFVLTDERGKAYTCRCLLMATGAVKPHIPEEIEGSERQNPMHFRARSKTKSSLNAFSLNVSIGTPGDLQEYEQPDAPLPP